MKSITGNIALAICALSAAAIATSAASAVRAHNVIEDWSQIQMPSAPRLKTVKVDPGTTALLVLDIIKQGCNNARRPRCVNSVPEIRRLIDQARAHHMLVVYSITTKAKKDDILRQVAPRGREPVVVSSPDKFVHTDLNRILKAHHIETVIVTGTVAEGAVLFTSGGAAFRGFKVIVPIEGSSSGSEYGEAGTAWFLTHAPALAQKTTLTKVDMISY